DAGGYVHHRYPAAPRRNLGQRPGEGRVGRADGAADGRQNVRALIVAEARGDAQSLELVGIAHHGSPVVAGLADGGRKAEARPGGCVIAYQLGAGIGRRARIEDVVPRDVEVLSSRTPQEKASAQLIEFRVGHDPDAAQIDGADRACPVVASHDQATDVLVVDPPGDAARIAEVSVDVVRIERARQAAVDLRAELAVLVELTGLGGRAPALDLDDDVETHPHLRRHARVTAEDEARRGVGIVEAVVRSAAGAVVPVGDHAVDLAAYGQVHLAVALARRRRF